MCSLTSATSSTYLLLYWHAYFRAHILAKIPPYFTVTVKWMDAPQVSQLCDMLDTIWAELKGQEVVYQWVEWLRDSSRSHLWFDGKITLGTDIIITHDRYNHAISRTNSLESVIPLMMSYCSKKHYQAFLEDLHMCMICLNQSKGMFFSFSFHFSLLSIACHLFCNVHVTPFPFGTMP